MRIVIQPVEGLPSAATADQGARLGAPAPAAACPHARTRCDWSFGHSRAPSKGSVPHFPKSRTIKSVARTRRPTSVGSTLQSGLIATATLAEMLCWAPGAAGSGEPSLPHSLTQRGQSRMALRLGLRRSSVLDFVGVAAWFAVAWSAPDRPWIPGSGNPSASMTHTTGSATPLPGRGRSASAASVGPLPP